MSEPHGDPYFEELQDHAERQRTHGWRSRVKPPTPVGEILAQLIQRKGYAQIRTASQWQSAWRAVAGPFDAVTEVGVLRRGVLEIQAANSLVMQELAFEKERLLAALQQALPTAGIKQLRFKVGQIQQAKHQ